MTDFNSGNRFLHTSTVIVAIFTNTLGALKISQALFGGGSSTYSFFFGITIGSMTLLAGILLSLGILEGSRIMINIWLGIFTFVTLLFVALAGFLLFGARSILEAGSADNNDGQLGLAWYALRILLSSLTIDIMIHILSILIVLRYRATRTLRKNREQSRDTTNSTNGFNHQN